MEKLRGDVIAALQFEERIKVQHTTTCILACGSSDSTRIGTIKSPHIGPEQGQEYLPMWQVSCLQWHYRYGNLRGDAVVTSFDKRDRIEIGKYNWREKTRYINLAAIQRILYSAQGKAKPQSSKLYSLASIRHRQDAVLHGPHGLFGLRLPLHGS